MICIGTIKKAPGNDECAFDLDIYQGFNFIDNLDIFPQDLYFVSSRFYSKPGRDTFLALPILTQEVFHELNRVMPNTGAKYQFLENVSNFCENNKYGIFIV